MQSIPILFADAVVHQLPISSLEPLAQISRKPWKTVCNQHLLRRKEYCLVHRSFRWPDDDEKTFELYVYSLADGVCLSLEQFLKKTSKYDHIVEVSAQTGLPPHDTDEFYLTRGDAQLNLDLLKPKLPAVKRLHICDLEELMDSWEELRFLWKIPVIEVVFANETSCSLRSGSNAYSFKKACIQREVLSSKDMPPLPPTDLVLGVQNICLSVIRELLLHVNHRVLRPVEYRMTANAILKHDEDTLGSLGFVDAPELLPFYEDEHVKNISKWEHPSGMAAFVLGWGHLVDLSFSDCFSFIV